MLSQPGHDNPQTVRTTRAWPGPRSVLARVDGALLLIVIVAAVLRLVWLGSVPLGLSHDEAVKGYDAWSVLHTGRDQYGAPLPLVFRAIGDQREAVLPYLIVASEAALGPTDVAVRLPTALLGVALVGALYLLGRAAFGRSVGLLAAALLAVSPWHIQVSRLAFRAGLLPLAIVLGLWLLLRQRERPRQVLWAGIALGMGLHTYLAARVTIPLLLVGIVLVERIQGSRFNAQWRRAQRSLERRTLNLELALGVAMVAAPLVVWAVLFPAQFLGHAAESAGGGGLPRVLWESAGRYAAYVGVRHLVTSGDPYPIASTGRVGALLWPVLPLLPIGLIVMLRRRARADLLILWWLLVAPVASALTRGSHPDWLRAAGAIGALELIAAVGGVALWRWLTQTTTPSVHGSRATRTTESNARSTQPPPREHRPPEACGLVVRDMGVTPGDAAVRAHRFAGLRWLTGRGADGSARFGPRGRRMLIGGWLVAVLLHLGLFLHDYTRHFPRRAAWAYTDGAASAIRALTALESGYGRVVLDDRVAAMHDLYLFYSRYDPRQLQREGLRDIAGPGEWARVQGFGAHAVCNPESCCAAGDLCLVRGAWLSPAEVLTTVPDRTGRIAFSIVAR